MLRVRPHLHNHSLFNLPPSLVQPSSHRSLPCPNSRTSSIILPLCDRRLDQRSSYRFASCGPPPSPPLKKALIPLNNVRSLYRGLPTAPAVFEPLALFSAMGMSDRSNFWLEQFCHRLRRSSYRLKRYLHRSRRWLTIALRRCGSYSAPQLCTRIRLCWRKRWQLCVASAMTSCRTFWARIDTCCSEACTKSGTQYASTLRCRSWQGGREAFVWHPGVRRCSISCQSLPITAT